MPQSLFHELKRRNVFRVAIAYVVISWLLIQVIGLAADSFEAPVWVMKMIITLIVIGFIPTLFFSWAFEITADGVKKESEVNHNDSITNITAKKLDVITLVALLSIGGLVVWQQFNPKAADSASKAEMSADIKQNSNQAPSIKHTQSLIKGNIQAKNIEPSNVHNKLTLGVAVLPFENLSANPDNAFFAGGVYEDVLTYLSRIVQLRVISRTSMEKIAEKGMEIRTIGQYLDVSHVLEGSVRRAGNRVRVTVQLIKASNDEHIWAENYDRGLDDIFAIQTEIAQKIAQKLKTKLTTNQQQLLENHPTSNINAYDLFLKAREIGKVWLGSETFAKQIPLLEQAVQLDPNFVQAQVRLVESYGRMAWTGADPNDIYRPKAESLKNQIIAKHPNTAEAFAAQGYYEYTINRNYQEALSNFLQALSISPNNSDFLIYVSSSYKRLGKYDQGIQILKKLVNLDPESSYNANELANQLRFANRIDEAFALAKVNLKKFPQNMLSQTMLANLYFRHKGDIKKYLKIIKKMAQDDISKVTDLYLRLIVNKDNIQGLVARLEATKKADGVINNAKIDVQISELFNLVGLEKQSQQWAQKSLVIYQQHPKARVASFANQVKIMNSVNSYTACLADDKAAFHRYSKAFQLAKPVEWFEQVDSNSVYALVLAECGQIDESWELLNTETKESSNIVTSWELILDPLYRHYFSELPEFKALERKMQKQKQAETEASK